MRETRTSLPEVVRFKAPAGFMSVRSPRTPLGRERRGAATVEAGSHHD